MGRRRLPHLLRHFGATTLRVSSARCRNSFHSLLRMNGTSNIGIASRRLVASDQQVWCPRLRASRRWGNRLHRTGNGGRKGPWVSAPPVTFALSLSPAPGDIVSEVYRLRASRRWGNRLRRTWKKWEKRTVIAFALNGRAMHPLASRRQTHHPQ